MSRLGQDFVSRLLLVFIQPPNVKECERPTGPERSLADWRQDIERARLDSLNKPGVYLDRSPTGAGKTTADIEAVRKSGRGLIVLPSHENCAEVEAAMRAAGIDAKRYPARITKAGGDQNCWNESADVAERLSLSASAAVCVTCPHKSECEQSGYLAELKAVDAADVAIATHARARHMRFSSLMGDREFVSNRHQFVAVHEAAANLLRPTETVTENDLQRMADILHAVLNDPQWLDWFGDTIKRDDDGNREPDTRKAKERGKLFEFIRHLADVADMLLERMRVTERTSSIELPAAMPKANRIEFFLLTASTRLNATTNAIPWRVLLAVATGELFSLGAMVDDQPNHRTDNQSETAKDTDCRLGQSAES